MKKTVQTLVASVLLAGLALSRAALIAYDGFESYTAGSNMPDRGAAGEFNGGTGWSNAWDESAVTTGDASVISQSLTYSAGNVTVNGGVNTLQLESNNDDIALRSYAPESGTVFVSYLFRTPSSAGNNPDRDFIQQWNRPTETYIADGNASLVHDLTGGETQFGARINSSSATNFGSPPNTQEDTTYFLVTRISKTGFGSIGNYETVDVFVNPTSTTTPGTPTATMTDLDSFSSLSSIGFRLALVESNADTYLIDEIRVGTSWDAVVIPEPSTFILVGAALTALVLFRRRG